MQQVEDALKNEEAHHLGAAAVAAAASSSGSSIAAPASTLSVCAFCGKPRHTVEHHIESGLSPMVPLVSEFGLLM